MRPLVVLGATGSIGRQSLEVAERLGIPVAGVAARHAGDDLAEIAAAHADARVVATDPGESGSARFSEAFGTRYAVGSDAMTELAAIDGAVVVNGVVGAAGLSASLAALRAGNRLGLANKESLVAGGPLVLETLAAGDGEIIPIDSEHSALFQCMVGEQVAEVSRLVLTASGGPFRGQDRASLTDVTPDEALAHPTWNMGSRITIDSATLVNKGLEVIEAHFLFDLSYDDVDVVVHPQSIVHSLVEFTDGSLKAHLGATDMRIPIQYALTYPDRADAPFGPFDLTARDLTFETPDREAFPALGLAYAAGRGGGTLPAAFNAADEVAVAAFLAGRIGFLDITACLEAVLEAHERVPATDLDAIVEADGRARSAAEAWVESR